ncbi:MAG: WYL domain-containing protein [Bacillota bacterium]|nr:WYL domain-containing protein [Bacillota bacterium]
MKQRKVPSPSLAERLLYLYCLLHSHLPYGGVSFVTIYRHYEELISDYTSESSDRETIRRNIFRDLERLEEFGIGLHRPDKPKGKYCLQQSYLPKLSVESAAAVYTSMLLNKNTLLDSAVNSAQSEIEKAFFTPIPDLAHRLKSRIYVIEDTLINPQEFGNNLGVLIRAVTEGFCVKVNYRKNAGQLSKRFLEPVGIICKRRVWYIAAREKGEEIFKTYRIDQIESLSARERDKFEYPEYFNLQEHIGDSWGVFCNDSVQRVLLKFTPKVAFRVRKLLYHPSQRILTELDDGSLVVEFHVCGLIELQSWILQWGMEVEVMEPEGLRRGVAEMAQGIVAKYNAAGV